MLDSMLIPVLSPGSGAASQSRDICLSRHANRCMAIFLSGGEDGRNGKIVLTRRLQTAFRDRNAERNVKKIKKSEDKEI